MASTALPEDPVRASSMGAAVGELGALSSAALKRLLSERGIRHEHCLERAELLALAAVEGPPLAAAAAGGVAPSARASIPTDEAFLAMETPALLQALRGIHDTTTQRAVTDRIRGIKLQLWRLRPQFRGMAQHLVEDVHSFFREAFSSLLARSKKSGAVDAKAFASINLQLHHHHEIEDAAWFPKLRRLHPELAREVDVLERDHASLVELEDSITRARDLTALTLFVARLLDHLNREEILSVPHLMDGSGGL